MTKKAIITTHDGREATIVTKASNVLFEDGQTAQDILNDRQDTMITPVITTSTSMSKVGQGDSVDYSENVVDGAHESCVLKGNTKVNLIQEPSSQDVVLPYEFTDGQSVTITDTKESGALGVELKGQTLVNLLESSNIRITNGSVNEINFTYGLDTSKTYILKYRINTMPTLTDTSDAARLVKLEWYNNSSGGFKNILVGDITVGENKYVKIPPFNGEVTQNSFRLWSPLFSSGELDIDLALLEYQQGMENWDIPYFEGMQSVKAPSVTTVGKNLLPNPKQAKNGAINGSSYSVTSDGIFTITGTATANGGRLILDTHDVFELQDGKMYSFIMESVGNNDSVSQPIFHLSSEIGKYSKASVQNSRVSFTYLKEWGGLILGYNVLTGESYNGTYRLSIIEGNEYTTYEPYKSTTLTLPEEITLRGIGNVKDTLNLQTGELTQRIGEIVLDGSENWYCTTDTDTTQRFYFNSSKINLLSDTNSLLILSDKLPTVNEIGVVGIIKWWNGTTSNINIRHTSQTTDEFKKWLSQNPITVHYPLATPITSTVSLTFTNQDNQPATKLSTYNTTTHINASSKEGSLIPILSHSNPTYPVILKPSTKYSIVVNSYSNSHTNSAINFNLGGATASTTVGNRVTTITTPSTLSNELLIMSGRGNKLNNVMVIEGDVVGDEPYFEGICDCKSPILSNVGKNLLDESTMYSQLNTNKNLYIRYYNSFKCKPNTTYYFYADKGETKCNWHSVTQDITGVQLSNGGLTKEYLGYSHMVTTPSDCNRLAIYTGGNASIDVSSIKTAIYEVPNSSYEPYKSNILSCNGDKIELTEDMFEQGSIGGQVGKTYDQIKLPVVSNRIRSKSTIKVKPNTTYSIKCKEGYIAWFSIHDANDLYVTSWGFNQNASSLILTTSSSTYGLGVIIQKPTGNITPNEVTNVQLHEVDKTIALRSLPNGICDTLNVETGEYVQRIGEVVFDGSDDESWAITTFSDGSTGRFSISIKDRKVYPDALYSKNMVCDKEIVQSFAHIYIYKQQGIAPYDLSNTMSFYKTDLATVEQLKIYLQSNPITVQYELATPITTTIDLQGSPYAYKDGHIQLTSGSIEQSLTPIIEYSVPTNRNGQIRSNQKMVEKHQKQLDQLQAIILANLVNSQYNQTLTTLKYELSRV